MILVAFICFMGVLATSSYAQTNVEKVMGKINVGVEAGREIIELLSDEKYSERFKEIGKVAGKLAPYLGALGPAISIITLFLPSTPSAELQLMKKEFAKIDANFDKVFDQFDQVKNLLRESTFKSQYGQFGQTILSLSNKLNLFLDRPFENSETFKDIFISEYENTYGGATWKLYNGMMSESAVSDNIPFTAMQFTDNNRRRTQQVMKGVTNLIMQGVKVVLAYHKLKGDEDGYNTQLIYWEDEMKKLLNHVIDMDAMVKNKWEAEYKKNLDTKLAILQGKGNSEFANELYNFLTDKFDWRDWQVVAFNEKTKHTVKSSCGSFRHRKYGRNVAVASVESASPINRSQVRNSLLSVETKYWYISYRGLIRKYLDRNTKDIINDLPSKFRNGCKYPGVGVIQEDGGIANVGTSGHLVTVRNKNFHLYVFG